MGQRDLDVDAECDRLFFYNGAALSALSQSADARHKETLGELWKLLPFIKALCKVGRSHQNELMFAWKQALEEPMPFGYEPIGLPKEKP